MIRILCRIVVLTLIPLVLFSDEDNIAQISLITETNDISKPFYIGIYFDMEEDWYIYWENPGDAGIPVEVDWDLPEGYTVGELIYPTPERFYTQGLISFGYKNEALIMAEVIPPAGDYSSAEPVISANVSWMVCKESCHLEEGTALLHLNECEPQPEKIDRYKAKLPKPIDSAPVRIESIESRKENGKIYITINLDGEGVDEFFPGPYGNFILSHKDIAIRDQKILYTLRPYSASTEVREISGLLFIDGSAYRFNEAVVTNN